MPNQFYVDPTAGYDPNALSGLGQALRVNRLDREKAEAAKTAEANKLVMQTEVTEAMKSRDPNKVAEVSIKYPEFSDILYNQIGIDKDEQKADATTFTREILTSGKESIGQKYEQRIQTLKSQGRDATHTEQSYADYLENPEAEIKDLEVLYAGLDNKGYKALVDQRSKGSGGGIGTVSPKDFTVESLGAYSESGDVKDLVRFSPQVKEIAGIPHQYNQSSLKWEPLVDMRSSGIAEQSAAQAEIEADTQSRLDFSKDRNKFMSGESKLISKISSARSKQEVMVNTAGEIKNLMSGWNTKYGASLSSVPGSEARKLKGLINTLKANSAFTTLADLKESGGTLGAISAPELTLLEAAMGTIDQGGDIPEQLRVIDQILNANESAISRLDNAYAMDKKRYSGNYDAAQVEVNQEQAQAKEGGEIKVDAQGNRAMVYPDGTFEEL